MADRWARCNFDGQPVHPDDQAVLDRFRRWLAMTKDEQKHAARDDPDWQEFLGITRATLLRAGPVLRQESGTAGEHGPYWLEWYCYPPPIRTSWRVLPGGEEWAEPGENGRAVRRIFTIELAPG